MSQRTYSPRAAFAVAALCALVALAAAVTLGGVLRAAFGVLLLVAVLALVVTGRRPLPPLRAAVLLIVADVGEEHVADEAGRRELDELEREGLAERDAAGRLVLTPVGQREAERSRAYVRAEEEGGRHG